VAERGPGEGPPEGPRERNGAAAALSGQVALITGASTGIGRHLAEGLAAHGMAVAGLARTPDRLATAMDEIAAATGARTLAAPADVTDRAAVEAAVGRVLEEFGQVDLLVNNAGLMDAEEVPVWEADPDDWWAVVTSHIRGALLPVRAVVPGMVARGRGRVINVSSGLALSGGRVYSAYSVGKTGLMRLTETLAAGLQGTGVLAFDLAPGVVRTAMSTSMSLHDDRSEWTDPAQVVALAVAIAAGRLDHWAARYLQTGRDDPDVLRRVVPDRGARRLRLRPYGETDPFGTD
jgi:NAD(P)-dependent dehydrogenase (short-subunit alcohol dehydrogenase family)